MKDKKHTLKLSQRYEMSQRYFAFENDKREVILNK